jgi:hypothetical protein
MPKAEILGLANPEEVLHVVVPEQVRQLPFRHCSATKLAGLAPFWYRTVSQ